MSRTGSSIEDLPGDVEYSIPSAEEEGGETYYLSPGDGIRLRTEDFISRAYLSENCDIEENILEFEFSYGYDCKKPYNLVLADEKTLAFASGNLIHFFDVETKEVWFRRSAVGGGIGHLTKNPSPDYPHIAIGENGTNPPIIIYEWPSLEIICILKGGTSRSYTHLNYSPNGELLASQGGDPDYLITIWNWPKSTILLRTKSYVNDVMRVMFSPDVPGHLTSCGVAHIKFWKMIRTFTGLKLKGEVGRFGKTEYSDIIGIYPMPDEKVISGCYWGNILVWDEGLIKLEVCRKNRKRCHDGPIVQFDYKNGELWTVSMDGRVSIWYYDTIDQADPPDTDPVVMMEPTYDFCTPGAEFMCIIKAHPDPEDTFYYAQDGRGGIWRIDLTIETEAIPSERLLKTHAGIVTALAICPWGPYFITLGIGGRLHLYSYLERSVLVTYRFPARGLCLLWVPMDVEPSGEVFVAACDDGSLRVCVWKIKPAHPTESTMHIIQITKPHNKALNVMTLNAKGNLLVTGGEDCTIFIYKVLTEPDKYFALEPIGYIPSPDVPSCLTWHNAIDTTIIVGCVHGQIMIVDLPCEPVNYTQITYILHLEPTYQRFCTYKSQIKRDKELLEIAKRKAARRLEKEEELKKLQKENPGLDIDEEVFLADSESEDVLEPMFIPEEPNKILWIQHTPEDTLWLSMAGYDAGYIYEYKLGQQEEPPYKWTPILDAYDLEISNYCYSSRGDYLILAMEDGSIRVNRVNPKNWRDLSNYWRLAMHSNTMGFVAGLAFSYDDSYFITCGHDGNVFTFRFYSDYSSSDADTDFERQIPTSFTPIEDRDCYNILSLEETIVKAEIDRINQVANDNKDEYQRLLQELREQYEEVLVRNGQLPASQQLPDKDLEMDARITENLQEKLEADLALVKRKFAFEVEKSDIRRQKLKRHFIDNLDMFPITVRGVHVESSVSTIKQRVLGDNFADTLKEVEIKILQADIKGRPPERPPVAAPRMSTPPKYEPKLEYFLIGLDPETIRTKLGEKINRLLAKYRKRNRERAERQQQWDAFRALKPSNSSYNPEDEAMLKLCEETIGDFKLKMARNYRVPKHLRETTFKKYRELLLTRVRQYNMIHDYNLSVLELREKKKELHHFLIRETYFLKMVHEELKEEDRRFGPENFTFDETDYPENNYTIDESPPKTGKDNTVEQVVIKSPIPDFLQREALETLDDPEEHEAETEWERVMRIQRYIRKQFEQSESIKRMEAAIKSFDEELIRNRKKRIHTMVDSSLITLHLLTLNQELIILKDCEDKEDLLSDIVHSRTIQLMDMQDIITDINNTIETLKKDVDKHLEKEKDIQRQFTNATGENKFFDFLRRIFKKKFKLPRVHTDDESDSDSSSSSSEEEEEEDMGSIDSKDFGIIRLDENTCPKGCDQNLYDMTFQLRAQRHTIEMEVKEINVKIEQLKKDLESNMKRMRVVDSRLKTAQDDLETFQREKQHKLNQIYCTVILTMKQLQNLKADGKMNTITDSLVFLQSTLTGLYKRVGMLNEERLKQIEKHQLSLKHLGRMKTDLNFMIRAIMDLRKEIEELMVVKFGSRVKIEELEEHMLRKLIFNYRFTTADFKVVFEHELEKLYHVYKDKQKELFREFRSNTNNMDLLGFLHKEKTQLAKMLEHQAKVKVMFEEILEVADEMKAELKKLETVLAGQNQDIQTLRNEIKLFKTKGYTIKQNEALQVEPLEDKVEEEEESKVSEWEYLDDYMYTECYAKEYWADKAKKEGRKAQQEIIMSIINDLFVNIKVELNTNNVASILKSVISDVMNKCDVDEIIGDLLRNLPGDLDDQQQSLVELTAEKLYCIDEEDKSSMVRSREILLEIVNDITAKETTNVDEMLKELIDILSEHLPLSIILDEENVAAIVEKLQRQTALTAETLAEKLMEAIERKTLEFGAGFLETTE